MNECGEVTDDDEDQVDINNLPAGQIQSKFEMNLKILMMKYHSPNNSNRYKSDRWKETKLE